MGLKFSLLEYRLVERFVIQSICRASLQLVVHELLLQSTAVLPACLPYTMTDQLIISAYIILFSASRCHNLCKFATASSWGRLSHLLMSLLHAPFKRPDADMAAILFLY